MLLAFVNRWQTGPALVRCYTEQGLKQVVKIKGVKSLRGLQILKVGLYGLIIIICLGSFTYNGLIRGLVNTPDDFRSTDFEFFYAAGTLWHEGRDIYDKSLLMPLLDRLITEQKARQNNAFYVNFYPPQGNALFSLLSLWNPETARLIMLLFNCLLLLAGMAMLAYILSWYRPLGLAEAALLSSFLAIGFARQNLREGSTPLNGEVLNCVFGRSAPALRWHKRRRHYLVL